MIKVREVEWHDPDADALRKAMGKEMDERYGDRVASMTEEIAAALSVDPADIAHVGVAYAEDGKAVGHAALRRLNGDLELKRMYVGPGQRGKGVSTALLEWAEQTARQAGAPRLILHTGDRQPEAVRLYEREGYTHIPVYAPYECIEFSICMEKRFDGGAR